jgi:GMP synthase (glutamine-hydrolysing)
MTPEGGSALFAGVNASQVWMSHSDTCTALAEETKVIARNADGVPVALQFGPRVFGIQFHPEVSHSHEGSQMLANFIALADDPPRFEMASFKDHLIGEIRKQVGNRKVVCGVSGGVDSTVLAVLLHEAKVPLRAVFVDHGLLRKDEAVEVQANFARLGVPIETVYCADRFLGALAGETDPEKKRKIIGNLFLDVFWDAIGEEVELFAQGTLYPDVIESASSGSIASKIKTHHNRVDRILDLQKEGRVLEPLADLFKDEVRALGAVLGIDHDILWRHPFPGPGLAVRCPGEVTEEKLRIIRECDAIYMERLRATGWYEKVWQAYAALIPVKTVGVKGDERSYEWAISIRAVTSEDAMTADWARLPFEVLASISNEILNNVKGINRVLYDISTKPPASIEWE